MLLLMLDKGRFTAILLGGAVAICEGKNARLKYEKKRPNDESQTGEIQSGNVARRDARISPMIVYVLSC